MLADEEAQRLWLDPALGALIERMTRILLIELSAYQAFAWAEEVLSGATIDDAVLARAGDAAAAEAETVSDVRGSAAYKRELLRVYVRRAVRQALDGHADGARH